MFSTSSTPWINVLRAWVTPTKKNSAVYILQTVAASAGSARCIVLSSPYVFFRPGAAATLWVGWRETAYAGPLPEKFGRIPTQASSCTGSKTRYSSPICAHVCVGSRRSPCEKYSIRASSTVSAPPSIFPIAFIDECMRMLSVGRRDIPFNWFWRSFLV